ncbi:MAG: hypothetical protein QM526_01520 [Alphaproteobacteria bacterium]|nr:hypothetical protein [Alphaproteobacteria bacterium]
MIIGIIAWVFTYLFFKFAFKSKQSNEDSESTFFFELGKMLNSSEGECNGTSFVFALLFISISVIFYYDLTEDWIEIYKTSFWGVYVVILLITVTLSIVYLNVGYKRSTFKKEFFEMFFGTNHQKTTIANGGILSSIKKLIEYIDSFAKYL